jgi:hypothetical protein
MNAMLASLCDENQCSNQQDETGQIKHDSLALTWLQRYFVDLVTRVRKAMSSTSPPIPSHEPVTEWSYNEISEFHRR